MENRCRFWLPKKKRFCANASLQGSQFCGNHKPESEEVRVPCPVDPSHSILQENLEAHIKRCPSVKQAQALQAQPFYKKGVNGGMDEVDEVEEVLARSNISFNKPFLESSVLSSVAKRDAICRLSVVELSQLFGKIKSIHNSFASTILESYAIPEACSRWLNQQVERKVPFQEKHALQQASILGNMEAIGILEKPDNVGVSEMPCSNGSSADKTSSTSVVEFGAGRGYLTHMLADCYGIKKVYLVERKSYKLKADRSLRQEKGMAIQRLRIDIEDLDLHAVESLKGPFLAIGKHLCGPATDLTLRCCLSEQHSQKGDACHNVDCNLKGLAIATCCHHLCQWKHYINKDFMLSLGITKEEFHAMTWFTSWAVDAEHGSELSDALTHGLHLNSEVGDCGSSVERAEELMRNMEALDRAVLGLICKEIIDVGRLMWIKEQGMVAKLVKYVPSSISPENHLLAASKHV
ncbi:hypothetical protein H6P81_004411 [Aristolochia fimbriata]|uniref:tRNA:m(4)X modification enzyme TRM13 n=1 Tax=Aristolochia fimbriata TaxID=158543 RepID=A0AAV7FI07_ARIFI|nr:hypothetical protein H6P81_004411 [Aristolochia fimbriata]